MRLRDLIARLQILIIGDNDEKIRAVSSISPAAFTDHSHDILQVYKEHKFDAVLVATSNVESHQETIWDIFYYNPKENIIVMSFLDTDAHLMQCLRLGVPYVRYSHRELEIILSQIAFKLKARSKVLLTPLTPSLEDSSAAEISEHRKRKLKKQNLLAHESAQKDNPSGTCIYCDEAQEQIYHDEFLTPIRLTPKLKRLFWILYRNDNQIVSYDRLITYVYDGEYINYNTLRMAVVRLKKSCGELIQNISGEGYMLACHKTYLQDKIILDSGM